MAVGGCTVDKNGALTKTEKDELVFADAPEPAGGKMDVYVSMARAAKYNVKPECQPAVCGKQLLYEVFPAFGDGSHQITSGRLVCLPQG